MTKTQKRWTSCELVTKPNQSLPIWERGKSTKFSGESSRTIQELGNIELYDLGEISQTVLCQACLKHAPEGLIYCSCGVGFRPSPVQKQRIKTQFEVLTVPYYLVRVTYSRGAKAYNRTMSTGSSSCLSVECSFTTSGATM